VNWYITKNCKKHEDTNQIQSITNCAQVFAYLQYRQCIHFGIWRSNQWQSQSMCHLMQDPTTEPQWQHELHSSQKVSFLTSGQRILMKGRIAGDNPFNNCPFSWGIWTPQLIHGFWAHPSSHPKWHLSWFSRFSTTHGYVQQIDR